MKGRNLDVDDCILSLKEKGVSISGKTIDVSSSKHLGNKSWGRIDFLCNKNNGYIFDPLKFKQYHGLKDKYSFS